MLNEQANKAPENKFESHDIIDMEGITNKYFYITKTGNTLEHKMLDLNQAKALFNAKKFKTSNPTIMFVSKDKCYFIVESIAKNSAKEKHMYLIQTYKYYAPKLNVPSNANNNSPKLFDTENVSNEFFYITKNEDGNDVFNSLSPNQLKGLTDSKENKNSNQHIQFVSPNKYYLIIRHNKNGKEVIEYYLIQSYQYVNPILDVPIE